MSGFGASAKKTRPAGSDGAASTTRRADVFLPKKRGSYLFRLAPVPEYRVKQFWLAKEPKGNWVPKFGYDPADKRPAIPVTVAVFDPSAGEYGSWTENGNPWDNAVTRYLDTLDLSEDDRKKMYAKEVFYASILDFSQTKEVDGKLIYPDPRMQFDNALKNIPTVVQNTPRVLERSAGKVLDNNGDVVGKHMYAKLYGATTGEWNVEEDRRMLPHEYTLRLIVSGTGIDTEYKFTSTADRKPIDWEQTQVYDLASWVRTTPDEVIEALFEGADWNELIKQHDIQLYPSLKVIGQDDLEITEDDLPF